MVSAYSYKQENQTFTGCLFFILLPTGRVVEAEKVDVCDTQALEALQLLCHMVAYSMWVSGGRGRGGERLGRLFHDWSSKLCLIHGYRAWLHLSM